MTCSVRGDLLANKQNWTIHGDYNLQNVTNGDKAANKYDKADDEDSYKDYEVDDKNKDDANVGDCVALALFWIGYIHDQK
eukprot:6260587-Ditylum_brightwellii.AAC.1